METLGQRLRRLRSERSMSVAQVAREIEVSSSTYRDWEYGRSISGEPYMRLAKVFNVSLSELMTGEASATAVEVGRLELPCVNSRCFYRILKNYIYTDPV